MEGSLHYVVTLETGEELYILRPRTNGNGKVPTLAAPVAVKKPRVLRRPRPVPHLLPGVFGRGFQVVNDRPVYCTSCGAKRNAALAEVLPHRRDWLRA